MQAVLSPANKNVCNISFILYLENKISHNTGILLQGIFNLKLYNNPPQLFSKYLRLALVFM